ncbi:hypothetical protein NIES2135_53330 [Leptolyngbya boryana NIES-2135]|jgi:hypothetical protein|uniref:Major capsid protein n=1 Tax=Leptolyngbya boryana NIES-2135 TaxID=1973484 RepID=A0A1Z4JP33_LEPBY|nr:MULTISPECIES: hypothetical protein [Leptolyngbya]BAY58460.1 hypothetical protein NIES2135_53330 [Leptolyngbya boryana NIES-2135]MBD2370933.1 hypothetical protein [Leptolyngbya sp. FACHB-161]MBD2377447.1 hypothetical protein [Leptolyngbya sp. FACHB-238]MBD2401855.1 hypothetical protein [Leptolyngbya sp. FACHB-239]MBD2408373.1 hypothetical protein [Leptolyngbya sp. FACHB-402]
MKKAIVELTSAGITSEAELKELVQAKKQKTPVGFAKTATATVKVEKSLDEPLEQVEVKSPEQLQELAEPITLPQPATFTIAQAKELIPVDQMKEMFTVLDERHQQELQAKDAEAEQIRQENEQLRSQNEQLAQQAAQSTQELTKAQKDAKTLEDLGRLMGKSIVEAPMVNTQTRSNDSPGDLLQKLLGIRDSAKAGGYHFDNSTQTFLVRQGPIDWIRSYLQAEGKALEQTELYYQIEEFGKSLGFLGGSNKAAGPTTGASGSAPNAFLDVLSDMMRSTSAQFNAAWQFATTVFDPTSAPSKNILVPRFDFLPDPDSDDELLIAGTGVYNPIGYSIGTNSDSQALRMQTVSLTVERRGLGRGVSEGSRPVMIPEFHQAHALVDLMTALETRLMASYYRYEERRLLGLMIASTAIRYNDNGNVSATAGDVDAGDDGTMSRAFLRDAYTEFVNAGHQSLPDGCYLGYFNAVQVKQLKAEMGDDLATPTADERMEITNMLRLATGITPAIRASTYLGMIENVHVFMGNSFGKGAPGASNPTVQDSTLGVGATRTIDGFLLAPGAIGRGISSPVEIRPSGVNPFNMGESYIWTSDEGFGSLVDSGETAKIMKLRTTLTAV